VITFGVLLAAAVAGFNTTQLTVVFGALGVGIGFGLQGVVNNFVSGLVLMFERPIKVGDLVETSQRMGNVVSIGLRASTIRTFDGADVIVPNGDLLSKEVVNWTLSDRTRRAEILVRVAYGSDPDKVLEILQHVATEQALVLETPAPSAQMLRFGESALEFRLFAWTRIENFLTVSSDLHKAVSAGLASEGIAIAVPRHEVRLSGPSEEGLTADSAKNRRSR
jgi:small-conductance mechanosensitive channel